MPWQSNGKKGMAKRPASGLMGITAALKTQVLHGTVRRVGWGRYLFVQDRPAFPLFDVSRARPYKDVQEMWMRRRWG